MKLTKLIQMNWIGLNWIELDWIGLNWLQINASRRWSCCRNRNPSMSSRNACWIANNRFRFRTATAAATVIAFRRSITSARQCWVRPTGCGSNTSYPSVPTVPPTCIRPELTIRLTLAGIKKFGTPLCRWRSGDCQSGRIIRFRLLTLRP